MVDDEIMRTYFRIIFIIGVNLGGIMNGRNNSLPTLHEYTKHIFIDIILS